MAPHGNKAKSGGGGVAGSMRSVEDRRDILQAVVIADSFDGLFKPLTESVPRALLKLAGHSLIDYTLELLARSGVDEILVFCCAFSPAIRDHIRKSKWSHLCQVINNERCQDLGEAMREIEESRLIKDDFILVQGDLVSNLNLKAVVQEHKKRRKKEKQAVMTTVLRRQVPHPVNPRSPTSAADDYHNHATFAKPLNDSADARVAAEKPAGIFTLHPTSLKLLHHQPFSKRITVPKAVFEGNTDFVMHHDLLDCNVSICSVDVPQLFADNYDYQSIQHFISGVLQDEEISGQTLYCHILESGYMQRVSSLIQYHRVCIDVLCRLPFPIVPDLGVGYNSSSGAGDNGGEDVQRFVYGRKNIYIGSNCCFSTSTSLIGNVLIDNRTRIAEATSVNNSSIGINCQIGANVTIDSSAVFDNVIIGDKCVLRNCFLGNGVQVLSNSVITDGCVLGDNVKVGPKAALKNGLRLSVKGEGASTSSSATIADEEDKFFSTAERFRPRAWSNQSAGGHSFDTCSANYRLKPVDSSIIGAESNAVEYVILSAEESHDEEEDDASSGRRGSYDAGDGNQYTLSTSESESEEDDVYSDDGNYNNDDDAVKKPISTTPPVPILKHENVVRRNREIFCGEARDSIRRAVDGTTSSANLTVEINACRAAYNINNALEVRIVCKYVMLALLEPTTTTTTNEEASAIPTAAEAKTLLAYYKKVFSKLKAVVKNYARNAENQNECLSAFEHYCIRHWSSMKRICAKVLEIFYDEEIVDESVILARYGDVEASPKKETGRSRRRNVSSTSEDGDEVDDDDDDDNEKFAVELAEFREEVKVFVDWLANASSGDEEEDDE